MNYPKGRDLQKVLDLIRQFDASFPCKIPLYLKVRRANYHTGASCNQIRSTENSDLACANHHDNQVGCKPI